MTRRIGLTILALVVLVVVGYQLRNRQTAPTGGSGAAGGSSAIGGSAGGPAVVAKGYVGGEKVGFLKDEEVQRILRERYGLTLDYTRLGSIDMVRGSVAGQDFLWPSSQLALEIYRQKSGKDPKAAILFNSPMVLYSWRTVTEPLIKLGIVQKIQDTYYIVDSPKLIHMINEGETWKEIGLPQLYGRMSIVCTDPTRSNSGNMFAGLLADLLNGGEVVDEARLPKVLPGVKQFFSRLGYMQQSSGDLFSQFLQQGVGSYPMVVGYEAQLVEFSIENTQYRDLLRREITTLYPRPTVWSSHPLIALTPNGEKLLTALQDPEIQRLAWEKHGFRSGMIGVQNDPKVLQVTGVPATIENVIPMPKAQVMERIIAALSGT
jgi:hypothetical protein